MNRSKPLINRNQSSLVIIQVLSVMLQDLPFDTKLASSTTNPNLLTTDSVSDILRSIPRFFFYSPRSVGRQNMTRHRSPLKQRNLKEETVNPATMYSFLVQLLTETPKGDMAIVLARGSKLDELWQFLKEMAQREHGNCLGIVSVNTVTCLIKVLVEEGLVNQALALFYRMKQYHLKPDVYAYNNITFALCKVGNFKKARLLLEQMELLGFGCPPDTDTILIRSCCKYGLQIGCRKAIRRRIWEANRLFTIIVVNEIDKAVEMLRRMQKMNHVLATTSSYTPIIHVLCEGGRVLEARDFLVELVDGGSIPREYTYTLVCDALKSVGEGNLLGSDFDKRIKDGIEVRYREVKNVKPIMARKMML
ncbi:unnamed protein product [Dovyalis caffra]|uniref:Pentatricopeptide repeat-containing protein n=1 Tax=Dovyalis caffra TaxID=77055 RepID=A0AAV1S907_9ROSI|nr:unnamed protein product [Dovyalis caffra]